MKQSDSLVIGLTGGTGVGKTTVASFLVKAGACVADSDKIAREIVKKGEPIYEIIVSEFGKEILDKNEEIDRKKLGDVVFKDEEKLYKLNKVTHSKILEKIQRIISKAKGIVVIDFSIPLPELVNGICDEIWVVESVCEDRVERIIKRSGYTKEKAKRVIKIQDEKYNYKSYANKTIQNSGNIEDLQQIVLNMFKNLKTIK